MIIDLPFNFSLQFFNNNTTNNNKTFNIRYGHVRFNIMLELPVRFSVIVPTVPLPALFQGRQ